MLTQICSVRSPQVNISLAKQSGVVKWNARSHDNASLGHLYATVNCSGCKSLTYARSRLSSGEEDGGKCSAPPPTRNIALCRGVTFGTLPAPGNSDCSPWSFHSPLYGESIHEREIWGSHAGDFEDYSSSVMWRRPVVWWTLVLRRWRQHVTPKPW